MLYNKTPLTKKSPVYVHR